MAIPTWDTIWASPLFWQGLRVWRAWKGAFEMTSRLDQNIYKYEGCALDRKIKQVDWNTLESFEYSDIEPSGHIRSFSSSPRTPHLWCWQPMVMRPWEHCFSPPAVSVVQFVNFCLWRISIPSHWNAFHVEPLSIQEDIGESLKSESWPKVLS